MKSQTSLVNINQADLESLAQLPGIGPTLAERIIEYRRTVGPMQNRSELSEINGISDAMVNDILSLITTSDSPEQDTGPSGEDSGVADGEVGPVEEGAEEDESGPEEEQSIDEEEPPAEGEQAAPDTEQAAPDPDQGALSEEEDLAALAGEIHLLPAESVEAELVDGERELAEEGSSAEPAGAGSEYSAGGDGLGDERGDESGDGPALVTASNYDASNNDTPDSDGPNHGRTTGVQRSSDKQASGRGCSIQAVVAGAILGGLFGLALTTFILYFLNGGMLQFAGARSLRNLENDTVTRLGNAQVEQDNLALQMQTLQGLVEELNEALSEVATQQAEISIFMSDTDEELIELENTVLGMEEKISTVVEAAENFNVFLGGIQELLNEMALTPGVKESSPKAPVNQTPTPQSIPTEEIPQAETGSTPTRDPTVTAIPTRTPRPTGTPIGAQVTLPAESTAGSTPTP